MGMPFLTLEIVKLFQTVMYTSDKVLPILNSSKFQPAPFQYEIIQRTAIHKPSVLGMRAFDS